MIKFLSMVPSRSSPRWFYLLLVATVSLALFYIPHEQAVTIWSEVREDKEYLAKLVLAMISVSLPIKLALSQRHGRLPSLGVVFALCALDFIILLRIGIHPLISLVLTCVMIALVRSVLLRWAQEIISKWTYLFEALFLLSILIFISVGSLISLEPVLVPRELGAPMLIVIFWGATTLFLLFLCARPRIGIGVFVVFVLSSLTHSLQHTRTAFVSEKPITKTVTAGDTFAAWLRSRPDLERYRSANQPYPVFFATSAGGGGYAMAHSFTLLSSLTERCPAFPTHLFALVGVSGGSVGNALYHANIENLLSGQEKISACNEGRMLDLTILEMDHLSPVLGVMLFVELPRQLLFIQSSQLDRSVALGESFSTGTDGWNGVSKGGIWQSILNDDLTIVSGVSRLEDSPVLISVATNVATGDKFEFMPFNRENRYGQFTDRAEEIPQAFAAADQHLDVRIVDAVVASASFPWVTPTVAFDMGHPEVREAENTRVLADGGYFENSGTITTSELQKVILAETGAEAAANCDSLSGPTPIQERALEFVATSFGDRGWNSCTIPFMFVNIVMDAHSPMIENAIEQNFFTDPVNVLLKTRQARGARATMDFRIDHCGMFSCTTGHFHPFEVGWFESSISPTELGLPLGWKMPPAGLKDLQREVNPIADDCQNVEVQYGRCADYRMFPFFFDPLSDEQEK